MDDESAKLSQLEINSERYDQNVNPPPEIRHKYLICSTQRSGSFLLCRQLIRAGIGIPHEYFNDLHLQLLCRRWQLDPHNPSLYLRTLYARRTTPNGVWGTKLQWWQYQQFQRLIDGDLLKGTQFIFLYRTNIPAQAVSRHLSYVTGIWDFDIKTMGGDPSIPLGDRRHIAQSAGMILRENEAWKNFFTQHRIKPLNIRYEDFVADQQGFVQQIAAGLGLENADFKIPPSEPRANQFPPAIESVRRELIQRYRSVLPR